MKFVVITFPYSTDTDAGTAAGPKALLQAGLTDWLREQGHDVAGPFHVKLTPDEEAAYGAWNQIGLANAHLARLVSDAVTVQAFSAASGKQLLRRCRCLSRTANVCRLTFPTPRHDLDRRAR